MYFRFRPPDACYIELFRFRIRPPKNRELPLQIRSQIITTGTKIEIRSDILIPGFISRKYGQIPCEDIAVRFPIPECWIYLFRVEKHFKYGSIKASHRRYDWEMFLYLKLRISTNKGKMRWAFMQIGYNLGFSSWSSWFVFLSLYYI